MAAYRLRDLSGRAWVADDPHRLAASVHKRNLLLIAAAAALARTPTPCATTPTRPTPTADAR